MEKEFKENQWFNLAVRGLMTEIEKCYTSKKEGWALKKHVVFPSSNREFTCKSPHTISPSLSHSPRSDRPSKRFSFNKPFRKIYSCLGSLGTPYIICYSGFTCTCPSFRLNFNIENLWCKHLLALQLSLAMGVVEQKEVTEEIMMTMLNELVMYHE